MTYPVGTVSSFAPQGWWREQITIGGSGGTATWTCPSKAVDGFDVTELIFVDVQSGGGNGGAASGIGSTIGGAGGGGGGFAGLVSYPVTPGTDYTIVVGAAGQESFFESATICRASPGTNASTTTPGVGGTGTHGDVSFSGANGAPNSISIGGVGGGCGGTGGNGSGDNGGASAGTSRAGGGDGGGAASAGNPAGGGGGGANSLGSPGNGARGQVLLYYNKDYGRANTDSTPCADSSSRQVAYQRSPATESAPVDDAATRTYHAVRDTTDAAPAVDTVARQSTNARDVTDNAPTADTVERTLDYHRTPDAESAPADDTVTRTVAFARDATDNAPVDDTVTRAVSFVRDMVDNAPVDDPLVLRAFTGSRSVSDSAPVDDTVDRSITYGRVITEGPADVVTYPGFKEIGGVVFDPDGAVFAGATVWLVREADSKRVQTTTSAVDGSFVFGRDLFDVQEYFFVGFATDPSDANIEWADVSDTGLTVYDVGASPGTPAYNLYLVPQGVGSGGTTVRKIFPVFG